MNKIFNIIFIGSLIILLIINPENIMNIIFSGCEKAVVLCYSLISIYAFWLGIIEICNACGLNTKLAKILSKPINFLFDNPSLETKNEIALNFSSNFLGMGNAATPSGIKAMQGLDDGSGKINKAQTLLFLLNTSSIQLLPTTVIGLRISAGSVSSTDIILPTLLSSFIAAGFAILVMLIIEKFKRKRAKK